MRYFNSMSARMSHLVPNQLYNILNTITPLVPNKSLTKAAFALLIPLQT